MDEIPSILPILDKIVDLSKMCPMGLFNRGLGVTVDTKRVSFVSDSEGR